ncbi:hypothetical protein FZZ91_10390 [Synechococcus sp. HB1133]|nr:hypothetical protein [Synechococcus sp. HB1133]NHI82184.1 hypothetical protein [Synechococcus sp. HB1133]
MKTTKIPTHSKSCLQVKSRHNKGGEQRRPPNVTPRFLQQGIDAIVLAWPDKESGDINRRIAAQTNLDRSASASCRSAVGGVPRNLAPIRPPLQTAMTKREISREDLAKPLFELSEAVLRIAIQGLITS